MYIADIDINVMALSLVDRIVPSKPSCMLIAPVLKNLPYSIMLFILGLECTVSRVNNSPEYANLAQPMQAKWH